MPAHAEVLYESKSRAMKYPKASAFCPKLTVKKLEKMDSPAQACQDLDWVRLDAVKKKRRY